MSGSQSGGSSRPLGSPRSARFGVLLVSASLLASLFGGVSARPVLADPAGTALQFNGSNQYVTFGASPSLGVTNFTIELWFKRTGAGVGMPTSGGTGGLASAVPLLTKGAPEGDDVCTENMSWFLGIDTATNALAADFETGTGGANHGLVAGTAVSNNVWHHAAVTYDGSNLRIYLDGALDGTVAATGLPCASGIQHAALGTAMDSAGTPGGNQTPGYFAGVLDEARVWNVAHNLAQIQATKDVEITAGTGLVARWGLNEGAGTTTADSVGSVTGTLVNGPVWVAGFEPPGNAAPVCSDVILSTPQNTAGDADPSCTDIDGDPLTYAIVAQGAHGTASVVAGKLHYVPTGGYSGSDTFTYRANDGEFDSNTASVFVTVTAPGGNYALQFNGSNQYVTFGASPSLGVTNFTIELWFKRTGAGVGMPTSGGTGGLASAVPLLTKGAPEGDDVCTENMSWFLGIDTATNALAADFETGTGGANHGLVAGTAVSNNVWHHAAVTYDGSNLRIYLDGALDGTVAATGLPCASGIQHAALGTAMDSAGTPGGNQTPGYFAGVLDEARVWNVAHNLAQIQATKDVEITAGTGLVARWGLNEGAGTTTADSVGSVTGTLVNGPVWVAGFEPPGNYPPTCSNVYLTTERDTAGDADPSCTDIDGDPLTYAIVAQGAHGTASVVAGKLHYVPTGGYEGPDTFTYRANDGEFDSNTASVFVTVSAPGGDVVLVGAGDIADGGAGAGQTAALIAALPAATVFTVGDNAYPEGTASDFATKYDPTWGPFKARTHPSVGNHDWTNRNAGFFPYFGAANVGSPNGYYSYDLGAFWHVIVLNTEIAYGAGSTQELWLRADLAANASKNVVAYFHRPRFSSDNVHGTEVAAGAIWDALYEYGADLVLNGHAHWFERFAPQTPAGVADATHGIRQLTCGTGGGSRYALGTLDANSEVHDGSTWGVCKITLHETSYDWQFIPVAGGGFTDSGTTAVHAAPAVNHAPTIDLSAPADGATGVSLDPTLDAVPSDVDGDSLDVTFYGRTAGGGAGSVGIVQDIGATSNSTAGQTATVLSVSKTVTTGNMIVVGFAYFAGQGAEAVTDDLGNTYTRVERADNAGVATGSLWYAPVTAGGALTSITATHPASGDNVIQAVELSAGTLSAAGGGDAGLGTAATWAASRTIPANGLAIGFASTNGSTAHSAGPASGSPSTAITMHRYYQGASSLESSFVSAAAGSTQVTGFTGTTTFASMYFVSAGAIFTPANPWSLVGTDTGVASGAHAVVAWPGRAADTVYEWYATVSDGVLSAPSPTRSFTTGGGGPATGFLRVTSSPALPTQISIDGVIADSWGLNWLKLAPGSYTVSFSHIEGFTEPAPQVVIVTAGATTTVTGTFTARGTLRVITDPAVAGRIVVDGVPRNQWGLWTDLPAGVHQVCFGPVAGFDPPACEDVTLTAGVLSPVTGTYTANAAAPGATGVGFLRVTSDPAVRTQISIDGVIADSWGLTWVELAPGPHTVSFSHVEGFTEPAPVVVTVTDGAITTLAGTFVARGSLRVITSPAVAGTITVDGIPRNDWGMWTDLPVGMHTVCFGAVPGFTAPACQNPTLTAGALSTVTGTYTP